MCKINHTRVTINFPQEAETFSILGALRRGRRALGHVPRGIHLSLRTMASAVAMGDEEMSGTFLSSFLTLSDEKALYIMTDKADSTKPFFSRKMTLCA